MRIILSIVLALAATFVHADPTAVSGSLTATGQALTLSIANNSSWGVQLSGTWVGSLVVEGTVNSTSWQRIDGFKLPDMATSQTITANGIFIGSVPGITRLRLRGATISSGTVAATMTLADSFPTGVPLTATLSPSSAGLGVSILASSIALPVSVTAFTPTVNINVVSQGQAITVAGTVTTVPSGAAQAVSIISGVGGVSVTATLASGGAAQAVSVLTSVLPTGAATQATSLSIVNELTNVLTQLQDISLQLPSTIGQKTKAASLGVVLSSDHQTLGVSVTTSVLPTGAATESSLASIALGIPVSVTRGVAMGGATGLSFSGSAWWNTFTASPVNGTVAAGVNAPWMLTLAPNYGGSAIKVVFHSTTYTPDSLLTSRMGEPLATSATALTWGPFNPGMFYSVMATGLAGVSGTSTVYSVK